MVIGVGPNGRLAAPIPDEAALVAGGERHLEHHAPADVATEPVPGDLVEAVARIEAVEGTVAVLASGDPGWFGIVRRLAAAVGDDRLEVHPAPSAVAGAFASIATPWEDAAVVSAHGRDPRAAVAAALAHAKVAIMTDPATPPCELARSLLAAGCGERRVVIAARLGHADAEIHDTDLAGAATLRTADPNVVLLLDPARLDSDRRVLAHVPPGTPWARPTAAYQHRDGQISKPAVRALALAHLGAGHGRLLWDVGCGSGSVAVEAARLGAGVVAVDRDPAQLERAWHNAADHGVGLGLVAGEAPAILEGLPDPDAVFVGGGGRDLAALLEVVARRCRDRLVVGLATIERIGPAIEQLTAAGWHTSSQLVEVHDLAPLGDGHRLAPQNPVLLILAERP